MQKLIAVIILVLTDTLGLTGLGGLLFEALIESDD
jgi:hypothetical protein